MKNDPGHVEMLQEEVDEGYEPTDKEIREYAEWLGIDAEEDSDLLWIARRGLMTPLPKPWRPCQSGDGEIFYFNPETGENTWDHPCDDELRALYATERKKKAGGGSEGNKGNALPSASSASNAASAPPRPPAMPAQSSAGTVPASAAKEVITEPQPSSASSSNEAGKMLAGLGSLGPLPPLAPPRAALQPSAAADASAPPLNKPNQPASDLDDLFDMPLELGASGPDPTGPTTMECGAVIADSKQRHRLETPPLSPITSAGGGEFEFGSPIAARAESASPGHAAVDDVLDGLSPIDVVPSSTSSSSAPMLPSPSGPETSLPSNMPPAPPSFQAPPKQALSPVPPPMPPTQSAVQAAPVAAATSQSVPPPLPPMPPQCQSRPAVDEEAAGVTARLCRELEQLRSEVASQAAAHKAAQAKEQAASTASLSALSQELQSEAAESRRLRAEKDSREASLQALRNESAAQLAAQAQVANDLEAELRAVRQELERKKAEADASAAAAAAAEADAQAAASRQGSKTSSTEDNFLAPDAVSPPTPELASILAAELRSSNHSLTKSSAEVSPTEATFAPVRSGSPKTAKSSPSAGAQEQPSLWSQLEEDATAVGSAAPTPKDKVAGTPPAATASSSLELSSLSNVFLEPSPEGLYDRQGHSPLGSRGSGDSGAAICAFKKPQRSQSSVAEPPSHETAAKTSVDLKAKMMEPSLDHETCSVEELRSLRAELKELRAELREKPHHAVERQDCAGGSLATTADNLRDLEGGFHGSHDPSSRCSTLRLHQLERGSWNEPPCQATAPPRASVTTPTLLTQPQGDGEEASANSSGAGGATGVACRAELQLQLQALAAVRSAQNASVPPTVPPLETPSEATMETAAEPAPWGVNDGAKARQVQVAEERALRAQRDSRDTRHRLENAESELERLSWELKHWREDADDNDRLLRDTRSALHKEQASHSAAKGLVRESHREVQRLTAQLKSQEAESELAAGEVLRSRSELTDHEADKQRLQLQLQAREAELGQLRHRQKAHTQLSEADLRTQRLALAEREEMVGGRERFLEEREQLAGEAEATIRQQRSLLRSELQRAELAGLRAAVSELSVPLAPHRSSSVGGGERSRGRRTAGGGTAALRKDAAWPICSSDESFLPKQIGRRLDGRKMDLEAPTPSSSSATSPEAPHLAPPTSGEQRDFGVDEKAICCDGIKPVASSAVAKETASAARAAAAVAAGELPEFLRNWRKGLRHEHAALEEDRRVWRGEARKMKKRSDSGNATGSMGTSGGAGADVLAEVRTALDARAAVLNSSIGEYRALEKLHSAGPQRRHRSNSTGAIHSTVGSRQRASSTGALAAGSSLTTRLHKEELYKEELHKSGPHEEDIIQRWQHILQPQKELPGLRSSCRAVPPLSGRDALLGWGHTGLAGASALRTGVGGG